MTRPGVLLDRDGTLIDEPGYLGDPGGVRLYPGAAAAVAALNRAGLPVALITNQSGVARGLFTLSDVERVHARLAELLAAEGAHLDLVLVCPHHPTEGGRPAACDCRKPLPGLVLRAARELDLDLWESFAIGDAERDLEAARAAGVRRLFLVATGKGAAEHARIAAAGAPGHELVSDLSAAVHRILGPQGR